MRRYSWPLLLLLAAPGGAAFQSEFDSVRAASLGGAVSATGEGAADFFTTPSAMASVRGPEISLMYGKPFSGLDGVNMGRGFAAFGTRSRWGAWGVGAASFHADGAKEEDTLAATYATGLAGGRVLAGATVKRVSHRYLIGGNAEVQNDPVFRNGAAKSAVDADLGLSVRMGGLLRAGFTVRNVRGADVGLAQEDRLHRQVQGGLALDLSAWGLKASADLASDPRAAGGGGPRPSLGVEKSLYKEALALRVGANPDRFAAGLGMKVKDLSLDYAVMFNRALAGADSSAHQVQMTWRFSKVPSEGSR